MIIPLEDMKIFIKVDGDEENGLITQFITTAEELCEAILRYELSEFNIVPEVVKQAVMYAVANMYEKREEFDVKAVINTMAALLYSYRKECW